MKNPYNSAASFQMATRPNSEPGDPDDFDQLRSHNIEDTAADLNDGTSELTALMSESRADRVCNHLALALVGLVAMLGIASLIGGGALVSSFMGTQIDCLLLKGVGGGAIACGCVTVIVIPFWAWYVFRHGGGLTAYGACLFPHGQSGLVKARRIFLTAVLPFVWLAVALALSIGSIALYTLSRTLAELDESHSSVAGIDGPIQIVRDGNGLTHITAQSWKDAWFGHGYAQAQDRLWQFEFQRLAAQGRLAEHVGEAALKFDKQTRTLGFVYAGQKLCMYLTDEQRALLQAFVDGVNFYLRVDSARPPEFFFMSKRLLFFHQPEPFQVEDVCLIARLLQWQLSYNINVEIQRFKVFWNTNRTYDEVLELYTNQTNISHTIFTAEQLGISEADAVAARAREAADMAIERELYDTYMTELRSRYQQQSGSLRSNTAQSTNPLETQKRARGWDLLSLKQMRASNAWGGRAAGSSTPCGASDPHLDINLPSVWYYSHLRYPAVNTTTGETYQFDTSGVGMVGIPGVHIGKTSHVSWGITMSLTDLEDLYLLQPDPSNPDTHYLVNGSSVPFQYRTERIAVHGKDDVVLTVKESLYGPIASEVLELPTELNFAVWARTLQYDNTSITGIINLGNPNVTTAAMLRDEGFGMFQSPGFSIPIEDRHGTVGYTMTGSHPLRHRGHTGMFPTLGNGSFDVLGNISFAQLPTMMLPADATFSNPAAISCANQKIYPDGYSFTLGYDYTYPYRGARIQQLLQSAPTNWSSLAFHMSIQRDLHSNVWSQLNALLIAQNDTFWPQLTLESRQWLEALRTTWSGETTVGSTYPSFFFLWIREISALPHDAISAIKASYWSAADQYPLRLVGNPTRNMLRQCGGDCLAYAAKAFNRVAAQYPTAGNAPVWGVDLCVLRGTNLMMHGTILECMFERNMAKDGDFSTINVADMGDTLEGSMTPPYASSMRSLYDWSTPTEVRFVLPGGNSGNPYSYRYQNLWKVYENNDYIVVQVEGNAASVPAMNSLVLS